MKFSNNNDRIDKYLDELADEYKECLLKALLYVSPTPDDLRVSELLRLDYEVKKRLLPGYMRQRQRMNMFFLTGIAYTVLGLSMLAFFQAAINDSFFDIFPTVLVAVVVGITGLVMSFYTILMTPLLIGRRVEESIELSERELAKYEIIKKWQEIERIGESLMPDGKNMFSRSVTQLLLDSKYISGDEEETIRECRKARNDIIHYSGDKYTTEEMRNIFRKMDVLLKKLHNIVDS